MNHPDGEAFAVGWELRPWDREVDRSASRRQRLTTRGPYQAAVPARLEALQVWMSAELQAEAEDAVREITRFDAEIAAVAASRGQQDGEQPAAELAPLASVLLRTESVSSSEIEGITAGAKALALAAISEKTCPNARWVTANVAAMQRALAMADDISTDSILAAHDALFHGHAYAAPGQLRTEQVWIGGSALSPHTASFVPPHHNRVSDCMDDLVAFVQRTDLPVLAQVAIAHAQFETIHPFNDGNGRTGRALVHAMLRHADVTRRLTVPVSSGLLTDTAAYFQALTDYRGGNIEPIIRQFATASFRAVDNGRQLVEELESVYESWTARIPSRQGSAARRLLSMLLNQPAVNVKYVQTATGVALSAAQRAVEQLEEADILTRAGSGQRNRVWLAPEILAVLDAFADRVGQRA